LGGLIARPNRIATRYGLRLTWWRFSSIYRADAGVAQWQSRSFPSLRRGFDSLHPLHSPIFKIS
jgi:hypothetical protein